MKNSLITGGVGDIGSAIVEKLYSRGDKIFVFDYLEESNDRVLNLIQKFNINYIKVDLSNFDSIKSGFTTLFNFLDNNNLTLDILINNAGINKDNLAIRLSQTDWQSVLDVNLSGAFYCCQHAIKRMIRQNKSYIINISSIVGITGNIGQVNYAASKAGLINLTQSLAGEYGSRNILINSIAPGFICTQMTNKLSENIKSNILNRISLKRFGQPEDVASLVNFLTSGQADYITGSCIKIDGCLI